MDPAFEKLVNLMVESEKKIAEAAENGYGRPWFDFLDMGAVGQFEIAKFAELIDRKGINDAYASLAQNGDAPVKEYQVLKLANDFMAGVSRDFGLRRTSRIRSFMHGTARTKSHGSGVGPLTRNTLDFLNSLQGLDEAKT